VKPQNYGLAEGQPWFRTVTGGEVIDSMLISAS
jgi:hypothetical protein